MTATNIHLDYEPQIILKQEEERCKLCGKCCYYISLDKQLTKCKHLVWLRGTGKYICRIYNRRNTKLRSGKSYLIETKGSRTCACVLRKNSKYDFPDCPLNTDKPIAPWWKEDWKDE
jgi:hypothetical protein